MKNIFFDLCSIPIFILILWTCHIRKITKDHASRIFIMLNVVSLACAILDLCQEFVVGRPPLSDGAIALGMVILYAYFLLRNATLVVCLIYVFALTRTEYRIRPRFIRLLVWLPYMVLAAVLFSNLFTRDVFTITADAGYARGPSIIVLYIIAGLYGLVGAGYCAYGKRYLETGKWIALISIYALSFTAVLIQFFNPELLVEMFSTALALLMVMLLVMRPEESIDGSVGISSWKAYQADLRNVLLAGQRVQIVAIQLSNAQEIRRYLGENEYNGYIREIADEIEQRFEAMRVDVSLYFERPGNLYLITEDTDIDLPALIPPFVRDAGERLKSFADRGVRFEPKFCVMRCPRDVNQFRDIVDLGHRFARMGKHGKTVFIASELVGSRDYDIANHMEEILNRAVTEGGLEMYYQPIYDIRAKRFQSAEALARLKDREYGMIPPGVFIPAAENAGMILPIGEIILESVYKFISENDLEALGLSFIEINLSVAQCMQADLPETVRRLQEKYGISPQQVNFEVTETIFDNLSSVMDSNLRELAEMGYSFSLDDYGIGYSNIQRLRTLPLRIIKIDKSLVDDMFTEEGEVIIRYTVRMMKGINKQLVVEGVETPQAIEACNELSCDFIQGFYYSKPLPADQFVSFLKEHNRAA